jgi:hypothetical protein
MTNQQACDTKARAKEIVMAERGRAPFLLFSNEEGKQ